MKITIKYILFFAFFIFNLAFAQGAQPSASFLTDAPFLKELAGQAGLVELFNALFKVVIALVSVWAVIYIAFYGAKYALLDSFTAKKGALENIWPVIYGLVALLGTFVIFNTISSSYQNAQGINTPIMTIPAQNARQAPVNVVPSNSATRRAFSSSTFVREQLGRDSEIKTNINTLKTLTDDQINKYCTASKGGENCKTFFKQLRDCLSKSNNEAGVCDTITRVMSSDSVEQVKKHIKDLLTSVKKNNNNTSTQNQLPSINDSEPLSP